MNTLPVVSESVRLPRASTPEQLGISSAVIEQALRNLDEAGIRWHTCMVIRNGTVAAECARFPFRMDFPHCMYSISKNFTATALGFAVTEGLLSLDARVMDFFPDYPFREDDVRLHKLTIRHLVTMTAGKRPSYLLKKTDKDWLPHFFEAPWFAQPGEKFEYVNENIHIICAILQRVLGMSVIAYLQPRLFEPFGIPTPYWETDSNGIESGGWGLFLTPESMAKFFVCVQNNGVFNGKQVIPSEWLREATEDRTGLTVNHGPASKNGYGYSFWQKGEDVYCGEGVYGQLAAINRKNGILVVFTCGESETGPIWDAALQIMDGTTDGVPNPEAVKSLHSYCKNHPFDTLPSVYRKGKSQAFIDGKTISFPAHPFLTKLGFQVSVIPIPGTFMTNNRAGNITDVHFDFREKCLLLSWREEKEVLTVECGMDGYFRYTPSHLASHPFTFAAHATWLDDYTLEVFLRPMECMGSRTLTFRFIGGKAEMTPSMNPPASVMLESVSGYVTGMAKGKTAQAAAKKLIQKLEQAMEPTHIGRFTE